MRKMDEIENLKNRFNEILKEEEVTLEEFEFISERIKDDYKETAIFKKEA